MRRLTFSFTAAVLALAPLLPAHAAEQVLSFTQGNYCNGGQLCTNNAAIDDGYGSNEYVDASMGGSYDNYPTGPLFYYERGFGDLVGVAYSNKGSTDPRTRGRVTLSAKQGYEITLKSFDLGCFNNLSNCQNAVYSAYPGTGLYYEDGSVGTDYPGHKTVSFGSGYGNFISVWFGAGENVGIDNIRYDVRQIGVAAVPEPATWAMMILGFGAVGAASRRRCTKVLAAA